MTEETATNPVEDSAALSETGVEGQEPETNETTEVQLDEAGNPIADQAQPDPDDELEEVEREGKKLRVSKALKAELLMRQDYTRKTQELAEQRKALDAEMANIGKANDEFINAKAELVSVDKTLAQYEQIDWQAWNQTDPGAAQSAFFQYQQLRDGRAKLADDVKAKSETLSLEAQRTRAKQLEDGNAVLTKDIPGWGPAVAAKLADFATRELGYSRQEIDEITDPRVVKLIHAAMTTKAVQTKQAQVDKIAKAQATQPAHSLRGNSGQFAPSPETNDFAAFEKLADAKLKRK